MNEDTLLAAIDDAVGASTLCTCGKELRIAERDGIVYLECPELAGPTRLPARLAAFLFDTTHDRRPVGTLSSAPVRAAVSARPAASLARPVAVRG